MTEIILRDNSVVSDARYGRLKYFDEESREYSVRTLGTPVRKSTQWEIPVQLDQGKQGSCSGHGASHAVSALGVRVDHVSATQLYWDAQLIDPWPGGAYPSAKPFMEGAAVIFVMKMLKTLGQISSYHCALTLDDVISGLQYSPGIFGSNWYRSMESPDHAGFINLGSRMSVGGHCTCLSGVNVRDEFITIKNSWGLGWGDRGSCRITFDDFEQLRKDGGEIYFVKI